MTEPSSYVLPATEAESRRLGSQAQLYGGVEVLAPYLDPPPADILDAGCGAGHFSLLLARRLPAARVTGLELDPERLAQARAWQQADNLTFVPGDLHALPFPDGRFDLSFARFVLVHDHDPLRSVQELVRVTRPGGRVVAYDMIHEGIWFSPERPAVTRLLCQVIAIMRDRGAEPNQGLHLAGAMERAGLLDVEARVIPHLARAPDPLYNAYRDNWIDTVAHLAEKLGGLLKPGLADAAVVELSQDHGADLIVEITVLASGRKPGRPGDAC